MANSLKSPTIVVNISGEYCDWVNPSNAAASDNSYAEVEITSEGNDWTDYLQATDFGFSIPEDATVVGIKAEIEKKRGDTGSVNDGAIHLVKGGIIQPGDRYSLEAWPQTDTYITHGSAADLWDESWTPTDINNSGFGIAISAEGWGTPAMAYIDHIQVTVYYTTAKSQEGYPGIVVDDSSVGDVEWSDVNNAKLSDNNYATANDEFQTTSHYLKATNFGFSIPAGSVISGIVVKVERHEEAYGQQIKDNIVRLVKNGIIVGDNKADGITEWPISDTIMVYGSCDDIWGEVWSAGDIEDVDFGVALSVVGDTNLYLPYVDSISIGVYYYEQETHTRLVSAKARVTSLSEKTVSAEARIICISVPVLVTPEEFENVVSPVYLVWEIPSCCQERNMHAHVQVDRTDNTFNDLESDLHSFRDSGFQYWDGDEWLDYPEEGVTSGYYGNQARVLVSLTSGTKFWRVRGTVK